MIEQWERWEPIQELAQKYYAESICDTTEGIKILLFDEDDKKVLVTFEAPVSSYSFIDESFRLSTINDLDKRYGSSFYGDWTFFKVYNSLYVKWLSKQSCGKKESLQLQHFSLVTVNSIIDIINTSEPKIEFLLTE